MAFEKFPQLNVAEAPAAALYIAAIADELARLAKSHDLEALAYILDMARVEAEQVAQQGGEQGGEGARAASG